MAKRYRITNLSPNVQTFEGEMVQPRTSRVLELKEDQSDRRLTRLRSRQIFLQETNDDAENGKHLPAADPKLVDTYARLATAEGADREAMLADLGLAQAPAPAKAATAAPQPKKAEG